MIYILNCDKLKFFKTFKTFDAVWDFLKEKNRAEFDGQPFSFFGQGMEEVWNGEEWVWVSRSYYEDSAVLCPKGDPNSYFTFLLRCIDAEGNFIELE